jgi:hypothetical protein
MLRVSLDRRLAFAALAVMTGLCGCSASQPPSDTAPTFAVTPFGVAASTSGAYTVTMYGPVLGVAQGLNTIEIVVTDEQTKPVDGLTISLVPWMPAMGHGTSATPQIGPQGSGRYVASDVALIMPGEWQLRAALTTDEDAVVTVELP